MCVFENLQRSETFWKLQLTSAIVWTHYESSRFSCSKYTKTMCCVVAAIVLMTVQLIWPYGYVASTDAPNLKTLASVDTPKNTITTTKTRRHRNRCPRWACTARNFLWLTVGDFRWSSLLCTCSIGNTQRTKETKDTFNPSTKPR